MGVLSTLMLAGQEVVQRAGDILQLGGDTLSCKQNSNADSFPAYFHFFPCEMAGERCNATFEKAEGPGTSFRL